MAITFQLRWDEETSTETLNKPGGGATLKYFAYSPTSVTNFELREAMKLHASATWSGIWIIDSISVTGRVTDSIGEYIWEMEVAYKNQQDEENGQQPNPTDESTVVFEIHSGGGQSIQMTASLDLITERVDVFNPAYEFATIPALERLLGLKATDAENGSSLSYEGIPVTKGTVEVVAHLWRSNATITAGYLLPIAQAASDNVVNADIFGIFPIGTLKFIGFQASQQVGTDAGWDITLSFQYETPTSAADLDAQFPDLAPFTNPKKGHEYLDVLFMPYTEPTKNFVVSKPVRAAIHQVFRTTAFNTLFGT